MTERSEQRMIHIRIDRSVHRDLRRAAAEYDLTIQDIVSNAVEKTVDCFAGGEDPVEQTYTIEIEDQGEHSPLINRRYSAQHCSDVLSRIEGKLDELSAALDEIRRNINEKA